MASASVAQVYSAKLMNKKKVIFFMIFLILAAIGLTILIELELVEKYIGFGLIPLIIAYQLGQYSERKLKK